MGSTERYAEVAVGVAVGQPFHYRIPPPLQERIALGQRVLVPLGRRLVAGYIVNLPAEAPAVTLREIHEILDEAPLLDAHLFELTRRVADYYLAPWGEVIHLALPPSPGSLTRSIFHLNSPDALPPSSLSLAERQVWEALQARSPLSLSQLQARTGLRGLAPILGRMQKRGWVSRETVAVRSRPTEGAARPSPAAPPCASISSPPARDADWPSELHPLRPFLEDPAHATFLLFGRPGSSRAVCYGAILRRVFELGRGALLLVPEIALGSAWVRELEALLGCHIAYLHSGLPARERLRRWRRAQGGEASLIIGTRSAAFAPHPRLGLILIDDEHDPSFKQEEGPRYHAREVARMRAQMLNIPLLMASGTPSLESFHRAREGEYRLLSPSEPAGQGSSRVEVVDMKEEGIGERRAPLLSSALREAISRSLCARQPVVLLIHRRGYFSHLRCRDCGHLLQCPRCSVSLVLHRVQRRLVCHRCGREESPPHRCPNCRGVIIRFLGPGTEQAEEEVGRLFPQARIARMDRDALPAQARMQDLTERFHRGEIDVLVGTQMVMKALPGGRASLIGILSADNLLSLPDFRAGESFFSMAMGLMRKEGHGEGPAQILIQTYHPGHYVLGALQARDYLLFYEREMASRQALFLPPVSQLALIEIAASREERAKGAATAFASLLRESARPSHTLDGPAPSPVPRHRGKFHWHLLWRGPQDSLTGPLAAALQAFSSSRASSGGVSLRIDIDPLTLF